MKKLSKNDEISKELNKLLDNEPLMKTKYKDYKPMISRQIVDISLQDFYDQLFAEKAPYSIYYFTEKLGSWNVKSNGWKVVNK